LTKQKIDIENTLKTKTNELNKIEKQQNIVKRSLTEMENKMAKMQ
jgi:hypothetical protein